MPPAIDVAEGCHNEVAVEEMARWQPGQLETHRIQIFTKSKWADRTNCTSDVAFEGRRGIKLMQTKAFASQIFNEHLIICEK